MQLFNRHGNHRPIPSSDNNSVEVDTSAGSSSSRIEHMRQSNTTNNHEPIITSHAHPHVGLAAALDGPNPLKDHQQDCPHHSHSPTISRSSSEHQLMSSMMNGCSSAVATIAGKRAGMMSGIIAGGISGALGAAIGNLVVTHDASSALLSAAIGGTIGSIIGSAIGSTIGEYEGRLVGEAIAPVIHQATDTAVSHVMTQNSFNAEELLLSIGQEENTLSKHDMSNRGQDEVD